MPLSNALGIILPILIFSDFIATYKYRKEYDLETFSDEAKQLVASLQFTQNEIKKAENILVVLKTAAAAYSKQLEISIDSIDN